MFGHQDDQSSQQPSSMDNGTGNGPGPAPTVPPPLTPPSNGSADNNWQHPGSPLESEPPAAATVSPTQMPNPQPANNDIQDLVDDEAGAQDIPQDSSLDQMAGPAPLSQNDANDLFDIKQQALTQLSPLVGHLDQSPEEKFRTTMMMIQASDDQNLIRPAFEAAQSIGDEKVRAQALLDVVNEINYFTQNVPNGQ
jgi:hypothetical protein